MSDQDIFNTDPSQTTTDPVVSPVETILAGIKNEKGEPKYKSVEDALKALDHSQQFISTLQQEKQALQTQFDQTQMELAKRDNIEDFINRINPQQTEPKPTGEKPQVLSEEQVRQMVANAFSTKAEEDKAATNLKMVVDKLVELHGDKATEFIAQRAKELNTTAEQLKELAKSNPTLAFSVFNTATKPVIQPSQSQNYSTLPKQELVPPKAEVKIITGGATKQEISDAWSRNKDYVYKKLNVEN